MMFFSQSSGTFHIGHVKLAVGYSGAPGHVNDGRSESLRAKGPIPLGSYHVGKAKDHPRLGPVAMALTPDAGTNVHGRSGFFVHGDNPRGDKSASTGCIVLPRSVREAIDGQRERTLIVYP